MLVIIMGKTSSGKDAAARHLEEKYGIPFLVSYTTRPIRGDDVNGKSHWFIDQEEMDVIKNRDHLIAWTRNDKTGIEYCATEEKMESKDSVYILNPHGLEWGLQHGSLKQIPHITIYVECSEELIYKRAALRGDIPERLEQRLSSERDEFNAFRDKGGYDYIVHNNTTMDDFIKQIDEICDALGITGKTVA